MTGKGWGKDGGVLRGSVEKCAFGGKWRSTGGGCNRMNLGDALLFYTDRGTALSIVYPCFCFCSRGSSRRKRSDKNVTGKEIRILRKGRDGDICSVSSVQHGGLWGAGLRNI